MVAKVTVACAICGKPTSSYPSQRPKVCGRTCQDKLLAERCRNGGSNLLAWMAKRKAAADLRAAKILEMCDARTPVRVVAYTLGVSTDTVYGVLRKHRRR